MPQPPYSPDLPPCDFFLFSKLKRPMKRRRYATLDEIKMASKEELKKIFKNDFFEVLRRLEKPLAQIWPETNISPLTDCTFSCSLVDTVCPDTSSRGLQKEVVSLRGQLGRALDTLHDKERLLKERKNVREWITECRRDDTSYREASQTKEQKWKRRRLEMSHSRSHHCRGVQLSFSHGQDKIMLEKAFTLRGLEIPCFIVHETNVKS
ncbi:hypothetical protein LAZ67_1002586, partial [Cordylochernes scorpioides]